MPKKGIVKCQECDAEFEGTLPDNEVVSYGYIDIDGEIPDSFLVENLKQHHYDTAAITTFWGHKIMGHKYFNVFLEDGGRGNLEANSYSVIYKELGKERG